MTGAPLTAMDELVSILQSQLAAATSPSERERLGERLLAPHLSALETEPDASRRAELVQHLLFVHEAPSFGASTLERIATIAERRGDIDVYRRVLDRLASDDDAEVKTRALERLGQLLVDVGDSGAAVASWKIAARMRDDARSLYERVLDTSPQDREAAENLVRIHADAGEWGSIPEVLGIVLRHNPDRGAELLLRLEPLAIDAGALEPFVAMTHEAVALRAPMSELTRRLRRAQARARAAAPSMRAQASASYRRLIETFGDDDDAREYLAFVEPTKDTPEGHLDRRWGLEWRAKHVGLMEGELLEWAKAEADRGEAEEAVSVYRRVLDVARRADRPAVHLELFRLLEGLGRPEEALVSLASALAASPPAGGAHAIARAMIGDPRSGVVVAERLERIANNADIETAARLFEFLVSARDETATMGYARRCWYRRLVEVSSDGLDLPLLLEGAVELPDELLLWDAAERIGRARRELDVVVRAYGRAIANGRLDAELVEGLGRRMVALEPDSLTEASLVVAALERLLEQVPRARWALDRVKVAFGSEGNWDALFGFYDRAIEAAIDDERDELLDEAAVAARDLADDPDRAIRYFEAIHASRPDDAANAIALERLYERRGDTLALVALLRERVEGSDGAARRELQRRVVALWLGAGGIDDAAGALESMFEDGAVVGQVADLLERVARHPGQGLARERLSRHYESLGRFDDLVRLARAAIESAVNDAERTHHIRELVRFRVAGADGASDVFARATAHLATDLGGDAIGAKVAHRAVLVRAVSAWKRAGTDAEFADAAEGAWRAVHALKTTLVGAGDATAAVRLLERGARLRFERPRQRALLFDAAVLCEERVGDAPRATRLLAEVFQEDTDDPFDAIARSVFVRFAALLDASGQDARLASACEEQGRREARAGNDAEERDCLSRAGSLWERIGDSGSAVAAYARSAVLGSEESYEGLARLHEEAGRWKEAAAALEWLCAHSPPALRGRRSIRLAQAYVSLGDRAGARVYLDELVRSTPELAPELRAQRIALHRGDGSSALLAEMLEDEALHTDARAAAALLCEAASLLTSQLDEPERAVRLLELAVARDADDATVLALADLFNDLAMWERAAEVLTEHVRARARSAESATVRHRLAHALVRLGRAEDALVHLHVAAKMQPTHPAILRDLGRLAFEARELDAAERAYRALLLALPRGGARSDSEARIQVYVDLGAIAFERGDVDRAANLLESALDATLEAGRDPFAIEEGLRRLKRHDLVVRSLEWRIAATSGATARARALRELAESWNEHLGREPDLATRIRAHAEAVGRALDDELAAESSGEGWTALFSVYSLLSDEAMLFDIVRRRVDAMRAADGAYARAWLLETAAPAASFGSLALVSTIYSALLEDDPHDSDVVSAVLAISERRPDDERLVPLLETTIARMAEGADRAHLRVTLARILVTTPARVHAALEHLSSARAEDPTDVAAMELLASVLEREGRFDEAATVLESRLHTLERETPEYLETAWRVGRALERAGRTTDATSLYASILDGLTGQPADRAIVHVLTERLDATGSDRVADCVELSIALEPELACSRVLRLVELRDAQHDSDGLLRALELGLARDPANGAYLARLLPIHEESGDLASVAHVLRRALLAAPEDRALLLGLVEAHRRMDAEAENLPLLDAAIAGRAGDVELVLLRARARAGVGDDAGAVADVESIGESEGEDRDRAIEILDTVVRRAAPDSADTYALLLVDVLVRAGRPADAAYEIDAVLERVPFHVEALERGVALAVAANDWMRAADAYDRLLRALEAQAEPDAARCSRVVLAFADACARLGCPGDAREPLERVLAAASRAGGPEGEELVAGLERVCEVTGAWRRLSELLVARSERASDTARKATLLLRAASLLASELGAPAESLPVAELARAASPTSIEAALACAKLRMTLGAPREALSVLEPVVERSRRTRSPLLAEVRLEIAKAHLALDELVEALEALKAGFALDARSRELGMLLGLVAIDLGQDRTAERAFVAVTDLAARDEGWTDEATAADAQTACLHLAAIARARGQTTKAREWAAQAGCEEREPRALASGQRR